MTQQEQIAYLRETFTARSRETKAGAVIAVCDLAARALLTDDETEAVRWWFNGAGKTMGRFDLVNAVLRRLLPDVPVEHRLLECAWTAVPGGLEYRVNCSCGWVDWAHASVDAAVRAWAAHVRESGGEL